MCKEYFLKKKKTNTANRATKHTQNKKQKILCISRLLPDIFKLSD